jgi:hypothetical protein
MSDDSQDRMLDSIVDSRRSFIQKGVAASSALALGLTGSAAAQDNGTTGSPTGGGNVGDGGKALMFNDEFRPGAQFRVKSPVVEQNPDVEGVQEGDIWSEYNTRIIEYLNTNEEVYFFPAQEAEIQQGNVYELERNFSLFADDTNDQGVISVEFDPVPENDVLFPGDDGQLTPGEDFEILDGGGKALVRLQNYNPGALMQITSGVVEWSPRADVQGSGLFSTYNTRYGKFLNTNDEFLFYPAEDASVQEGQTYVMGREFDITDPEGNLVTIDLERVNEDDLPGGLFDDGTGNGDATGGTATGNTTTGTNETNTSGGS